MLEIYALAKHIRKMIIAKGLKPTKYIVIMVALWITCEIIGGVVGTLIFGDGGIELYLVAIAGAAFGGFIGYSIAKNANPAIVQTDINILDSDFVK